jgi:ligand-binding sensor domain-containing protein/signal transduction histidine kinase
VRRYTTADGLPHDRIKCVVRDSQGFLWFCTVEGLSRFDGYAFSTYTQAEGLPNASANDIVEDGPGRYWVATNGGGLCHLDAAAPECRNYAVGDTLRTNRVNVVRRDRTGAVWAGTDAGLFRMGAGDDAFRRVDLALGGRPEPFVRVMSDDADGLWMGTTYGLYRADERGRAAPWPIEGRPLGRVGAIARDGEGRLWIAAGGDVVVWKPSPEPLRPHDRPSSDPGLPTAAGEAYRYAGPGGELDALFVSSAGQVWLGWREGSFATFDEHGFRSYAAPPGVLHLSPIAFGEDDAGNVWVGTSASGAMKVARNGLVSFDQADGLSGDWVVSIFEDRDGAFHVVTRDRSINRLQGARFVAVRPPVPLDVDTAPLGRGQLVLRDSHGDWWLRSMQGLYRYAAVDRLERLLSAPTAHLTRRDGLPADHVSRVFEDGRGDVWIGTMAGPDGQVLSRWDRASGRLQPFPLPERRPAWSAPFAFAEDRGGTLWMSLLEGGVVRIRDGAVEEMDLVPPPGLVMGMQVDGAGRLWLAAEQGGLVRVDDPTAQRPSARLYGKADGLSSGNVTSIAEDRWGRIYVGTQGGVDRLDPETGRIKHYSTADGLAQNEVKLAYSDRRGALWFATLQGISRLVPELEPAPRPPHVRISAVRVAGQARPLSALGDPQVAGLVLRPDANQLQIEFVSIGLAAGEVLRYQYRLDGERSWSPLTRERSVHYAGLPAGRHRFLVRAVNADGLASDPPATVDFRVLAPFWRRWWFVSAAGLLAALLGYAAYRYRLRALLEVERVRTAIATDLHDDIGSSLSRIAILSEVARRENGSSGGRLAAIADISRELVDSMSDIVWSVNPTRDSLRDLGQRMRAIATEVFTAQEVELEFRGPRDEHRIPISADLRRHAFLVFKEAVNNAASHSGCRRAEVSLGLDDGWLTLTVADDGRGFERAEGDGHGLATMAARARAVGGELAVDSSPGRGTTVRLRAPLVRRRRFPWGATRSGSDTRPPSDLG